MTQQKLTLTDDSGSRAIRVLDKLTPKNGTAVPTTDADFLGQIYVKTDNGKIYMAVAVGTGANDWAILN